MRRRRKKKKGREGIAYRLSSLSEKLSFIAID